MRKYLATVVRTLTLVFAFHFAGATATEGEEGAATQPFLMPTPDGWRTETIPFPLDFAPELKYEGLEELRFAPGMFKSGSESFWSYAFVWWVSDESPITAERLVADLEAYFEGLTRAVAKGREMDTTGAEHEVQLTATSSDSLSHRDYVGTATTFDAFATAEPVRLNIRIKSVCCSSQDRLAILFELSPQPYTHVIWSTLAGIVEAFRCQVDDIDDGDPKDK